MAVVVRNSAAVERHVCTAIRGGLSSPHRGARRRIERPDRAHRVDRVDTTVGDNRRRGETRRQAAAAPGLHGKDLCGAAQSQLAHRLGSAASGLRPICVGDGRRKVQRLPGNRRIDLGSALAAQHRNPFTEHRRGRALAFVQDAAAARGDRCGHRHCYTNTLMLVHCRSYWAGGKAEVASTPSVPASWTARSRMESGTPVSLAMAANSCPA